MVESFVLMAAWSSDLDDQKSRATVQIEGHTLTPPNGWVGPKETEASGSAPSYSPSQSLVRRENAWSPQDLVPFGNLCYLNWRWKSYITTSTHLAGACGRRHALRWQIWPHGSSCDRPRPGHPILWKMILRRRTFLGEGVGCHIHTIRRH